MKSIKGFVVGLLVGGTLMVSVSSFAAELKQYILGDPQYPVYVNGLPYESPDLPIMNYEGNTYIPMRAVGDILGASIAWNAELNRAEISYPAEEPKENTAYRHIQITGSNGTYTITGEARVFEGVMSYSVSDGHRYLLKQSQQLNEGAPAWSAFTLNIKIPQHELPANGTLTLEIFEYSAKDGSIVNLLIFPLESFES
jgi:hypothetical protein